MRKRSLILTAAMLLGFASTALAASEPLVGPVAQTSASTNAATTISATYSDPDGVSGCSLLINGNDQGAMTLSGGSGSTSGIASLGHTFTTAGSATAQVRCTDAHGNVGAGASTTISVSVSGQAAVGAVTPTSATANVQGTLSADYDLNANAANCSLFIDGSQTGAMSLSGSGSSGTASATYAFSAAGTHTAQARCTDTNGAISSGATTTINVTSGNGLTVGAVAPSSATANLSTSLSTSFSGSSSASSCGLFIDGSLAENMTISGTTSGTASASHTFMASGAHTAQVRCTDANGTTSSGAITVINVSSTGPSVSAVTPTSATAGASGNLSATYSLSANATSCNLFIDGSMAQSMGLSGSASSGTANASYAFATSGTHTAQVRCTDANGVITNGATTTVLVNASGSGDVTPPSSPLNLTLANLSTSNAATLTWTASLDNTGVTRYEASIDGGAFMSVGNTTSLTTSALANGTHTISLRAVDAAGNVSSATMTTFVVNAGSSSGNLLGTTFSLDDMDGDATFVLGNHLRADFEGRNGRGCEMSSDEAAAARLRTLGNITNANARANAEDFIACGTASTMFLGAGERLGAINSFRAAFGKLPETKDEWFDVIKIGNGRFPGHTNAAAEARAHATFRLVWLRDANTGVTADNNAIVVLAYGLRPLPRNMSAEAQAIATFTAVYHRLPASATDWDTVRAVAYSGATR